MTSFWYHDMVTSSMTIPISSSPDFKDGGVIMMACSKVITTDAPKERGGWEKERYVTNRMTHTE